MGLFLPELQIAAERGSGLLKTLATSIEQILITLSPAAIRRKATGEQSGDMLVTINRSGGELGILHYLFIGICAAVFLMITAYIIYCLLKRISALIKWLFSMTTQEKSSRSLWKLLLSIIYATKRILSIPWSRIFHPPDRSISAEKFYRRLIRWGRFSGFNHAASETPREYGVRLEHRFPRIEREFRLIINLHDEALYGCISPNKHQISRVRFALRRIRSPLLWLNRMKSLCFRKHF